MAKKIFHREYITEKRLKTIEYRKTDRRETDSERDSERERD